ncbi:hypothetical protein EJB05_40636, partial [Eragrostis curvula]
MFISGGGGGGASPKQRLHLLDVLVCAAPPSSRHLVALHAAFEDSDAVHLVLDLCVGGDLFFLVSVRAPLPEPEAADLLAHLADALAGCHNHGVVYHKFVVLAQICFRHSSPSSPPEPPPAAVAAIEIHPAPADEIHTVSALKLDLVAAVEFYLTASLLRTSRGRVLIVGVHYRIRLPWKPSPIFDHDGFKNKINEVYLNFFLLCNSQEVYNHLIPLLHAIVDKYFVCALPDIGGIVIAGPIPGWENVAKVRTHVMKEKLEKFAQAGDSLILAFS